ncbi:hypothetical protein [Mycoplasma marinum]|uniref:Uncharacterized protein n=1 Tax=Mycoplasma marinum TaxID=1937190 RepID=A0A4R0XTP4_9MOLU|nr:hypothetical protein [Mycoplasma marinum]TCG11019.1 hypothetical protein C4B24_03275 [Mycoplasma marinum]
MKHSKHRKKGIFAASGVVLTQGLEAVMLPIIFYAGFMFIISKNNGIAYSSGIMSIKETFSLVLLTIYLGPTIMKRVIKLMTQKKYVFLFYLELLVPLLVICFLLLVLF